jgi:hypothetical protein
MNSDCVINLLIEINCLIDVGLLHFRKQSDGHDKLIEGSYRYRLIERFGFERESTDITAPLFGCFTQVK